MILKKNGLVFQSQVAYLIPIFGVFLGYIFLNEAITSKVLFSLIAIDLGLYCEKRSGDKKVELKLQIEFGLMVYAEKNQIK